MTPEEAAWLVYKNQGATRNKAISPELYGAFETFLPQMGLTAHVISGGQDAKGEGDRRTGSTRHDHGHAADVDFYMPDGTKLDWNNPDHLPMITELVQGAKQAGITGIGAGNDYMGAGRFHMGFGNAGVWGAGGKGKNTPKWLRSSYDGVEAGDPVSLAHGHGPTKSRAAAGLPLDTREPGSSDKWSDKRKDDVYSSFMDAAGGKTQNRDRFEGRMGKMMGLNKGGLRDRMLGKMGIDNESANRLGRAMAGLGGAFGNMRF